MDRLKGQVAAVTGGFQGIGKAISLSFATEGASLALVDKQPAEAAERLIQEIRALGVGAIAVQADITKKAEVSRFVEAAVTRFGHVDILVNNAGISSAEPFENLPEERWDQVIEVNLKGVFLCCQMMGNQMIRRGKGNIINISSILAMYALPGRGAYSASKAGVVALTKVLAVEWAKHRIRVNSIAPVVTRTEMMEGLIKQGKVSVEDSAKAIPLGRLAEPRDIASAAIFLASEESSFVTGQTLIVDGGYCAV